MIAALLALPGCSGSGDDSVVDVAFIGNPDSLAETGLRLSPTGQHLRAATREGLVALNERGEIVPAIAERWIVTDDGLSYIFRLRNSEWPDGSTIEGTDVRDQLRRTIAALDETSLGLDLATITQIRAMTGRVIEIRLASPMPGFLQLLAQPEFGLDRGGDGTGPFALAMEDGVAVLEPVPPGTRGLPEMEDWREEMRQIRVHSLPAEQAVELFEEGGADLVLGGTLANLPLADTGALSRGTVRLDAALGLFGLEFRHEEGFFDSVANREAIALAIDRPGLIQPFNIGGWVPTTRIVAPDLAADTGTVTERWTELSSEQRRARAAERVAAWESSTGDDLLIRVYLPQGPGSDRLFTQIARGLAEIGISVRRAESRRASDLALKDRSARYAGARWFLNQFNCRIAPGPCSAEADALVRESLAVADPAEQARMLAEAERVMLDANIYIPFGAPIRWSLARGGVTGFEENRWSLHPLFPLAQRPI